ncbi:hypothetical protein CEXT_549221 [Caerostris extrusa]|uniref:Uncharacterized protein n=1 Tax=Caerostris extrusa TaxID=172846 RepID=A0AAV4PTD6_CAEEX|nr:hypothetical protein CEXT_549221 [Caerostris extrusa]
MHKLKTFFLMVWPLEFVTGMLTLAVGLPCGCSYLTFLLENKEALMTNAGLAIRDSNPKSEIPREEIKSHCLLKELSGVIALFLFVDIPNRK